ncbi:unnamed protein product [Schistocephalus solidus]|uniref:Zinc finger protein n=1 Tax=Schistocephalus solidus TaxID=70667 RepID=A0A183SH20_SCHSO|nr:unnamed protein product [Schistocephalus solidus]
MEMTKPHLGEDEVIILPSVTIDDCLCHQHVLLVTPPEEDIIQQVPVSRPEVHPGRHLPHRKAEEGIHQDQVVFYADSWEEENIVIEAGECMWIQYLSPLARSSIAVGCSSDCLKGIKHSRLELELFGGILESIV